MNRKSYLLFDLTESSHFSFASRSLAAMGGSMKSEEEDQTYQQEREDLKKQGVAQYRLTAMFSATMPMEVERMARQYLRHPAIVSIGDQDSSKNARIVQKLVWLANTAKKEDALRNLLRDPRFLREKVIVFVNEKKHADGVGRMVERSGRQCVVLHGGKSQEQREENLETFRKGGVVMVATDVAGRGLDIPDVAHVINYDLPTRSIENYTHRIGRTGRAGKEGLATSLITDQDEGIMADLKSYLESTCNQVPDRLARHPAASSGVSNQIMY
jgi:ATP-dependent RNA helicase DDX23/PRP28